MILLVWISIMAYVVYYLFSGWGYIGGNGENTFNIKESYNISIPANEEAWLQVQLPVSYGYQRISDIRVEGIDEWDITPQDGFQEYLFTMTAKGKEQNINIIIFYTVALDGDSTTWKSPMMDAYLFPSEFIDSESDVIKEAVAPLIITGNEITTAENIHRFVHDSISTSDRGVNQQAMTASEVLALKKGVCNDNANLMTAMLRAAGIPARSVSGNAMRNLRKASDWSHPGDAHAWVEFYTDGAWHFADPTWGNGTFDNPDKWHLSYGMMISDIRSQAYQDYENNIVRQGYVGFGGMTAPLHFNAWSTNEGATVLPKTEIIP